MLPILFSAQIQRAATMKLPTVKEINSTSAKTCILSRGKNDQNHNAGLVFLEKWTKMLSLIGFSMILNYLKNLN